MEPLEPALLFKVVKDGTLIKTHEIISRPLSNEVLESEHIYILSLPNQVFVRIGIKASEFQKNKVNLHHMITNFIKTFKR